MQLLEELQNYLSSRENQLRVDREKSLKGLNIDNFVFTYSYQNNLLKQQIQLYSNYILVFYKYHQRYLGNLLTKLNVMLEQLNKDITIEDDKATQETETI